MNRNLWQEPPVARWPPAGPRSVQDQPTYAHSSGQLPSLAATICGPPMAICPGFILDRLSPIPLLWSAVLGGRVPDPRIIIPILYQALLYSQIGRLATLRASRAGEVRYGRASPCKKSLRLSLTLA